MAIHRGGVLAMLDKQIGAVKSKSSRTAFQVACEPAMGPHNPTHTVCQP